MEGERRLRAFVVVDRLAAEPVAAAAGREVVERPLQAVASEEPLECPRGSRSVTVRARDRECGDLRLDERSRVERLLVAVAGGGFASTPAVMARQPQEPAVEAALVAEPAERLQPDPGQIVPAERLAAVDQRLRQPRVVVR